ncbi:hypothetical protein B0T25DRAFT_536161 [Lasiosphaeria hispida]|uniref:HNH nuclease domain-containing protein n=1 Tax=Lasiosphaeria hispida TaxID=260671 RepID=A0AAJ0HSP0_9PEZI|nr:hypothetical protein B0T25DRAFT_536161 [Lasiosphaeria hispida]
MASPSSEGGSKSMPGSRATAAITPAPYPRRQTSPIARSTSNSPEGDPPSKAIPPSYILDTLRSGHENARRVSIKLRDAYKELLQKLEFEVEPDQETPAPTLQLALLGIELAEKEQEELRLERQVIFQEQKCSLVDDKEADRKIHQVNKRYLSAGDDLWRQRKKKMRLDDTGMVQLLDPRANGLSECLLALYKKYDGVDKKRKRPSGWRRDALSYYTGSGPDQGMSDDMTWCHISGMWYLSKHVKVAHIVPFFLDMESIGEMLFGSRSESLERAGNALLLSDHVKKLFDTYHLVVVPVDSKEFPITQWKTELISSDIVNSHYFPGCKAKDLDGKELAFLSDKRPVARFLYFHFIMALVRIKDVQRTGWKDVWARYYEQRPFATPGPWMRKSMLQGLANHFQVADVRMVESWIVEHGFETPLRLSVEESTEVARRVHEAVEDAILSANRLDDEEEDSQDSSSEDED